MFVLHRLAFERRRLHSATSSRLEVALCSLRLSKASRWRTNMDYVTGSVLTGAGATALMDLWVVARKRFLGIPALDYGLVGRWLAYLPRGRFRHHPIARTPQVRGERLIGWTAHY